MLEKPFSFIQVNKQATESQDTKKTNTPNFSFHVTSPSSQLVMLGPVRPNNISIEHIIKANEKMYMQLKDSFQHRCWAAEIIPGFPWIAAMMGLEISKDSFSFHVETDTFTINKILEMQYTRPNTWVDLYMDILEAQISLSRGRYPIALPDFSAGPSVLSKIFGINIIRRMYNEEPHLLISLTWNINTIIREFSEEIIKKIPVFENGYVLSNFFLWCRQPIYIYRYVDFFTSVPKDKDIELTIGKLHSNNDIFIELESDLIRGKDRLLELPYVKGVIIVIKETGYHLYDMIPFLNLVKEKRKQLVISCNPDISVLDLIMEELYIHGLSISFRIQTLKEAIFWLKYVSEKFSST